MCEVCLGIYYPLKFKLTTHKKYPIIREEQGFDGLRDRYRSLQLIKNRQGQSEKAIAVNFFGEVGYWRQLPKADEIKDYRPYLSLKIKQQELEDDHSNVNEKQNITFSF